VNVAAADLSASSIEDFRQVLEENPGPAEVRVEVETDGGPRRLLLSKEYRVGHTPTLLAELEQALAPNASAAAVSAAAG
jgi:hypothetical protein